MISSKSSRTTLYQGMSILPAFPNSLAVRRSSMLLCNLRKALRWLCATPSCRATRLSHERIWIIQSSPAARLLKNCPCPCTKRGPPKATLRFALWMLGRGRLHWSARLLAPLGGGDLGCFAPVPAPAALNTV